MTENKKTIKTKMEETEDGSVLFNVPFPTELTEETLASLKKMGPILVKDPYAITYLHSYGQDSPWFAGLSNKVLLGSRDPETGYTYATPRGHAMHTGQETDWIVLPQEGKIHTFTVCYFGSETFLPETPYILVQVEFEGADTLLLGRLIGLDPNEASLDWIGMKVQAKFRRLSKFKPTDVYFVPTEG